MLQLPHGCRCGKMSVSPKNWNEPGAPLKKIWYISYRFYDEKGKTKLMQVKGMNELKTLAERRAMTQSLLDSEIERLKAGFNPITGITTPPPLDEEGEYIISPQTPFHLALERGYPLISAANQTAADLKCVVNNFNKSAVAVGISNREIQSISRRHIIMVLRRCELDRENWSDNQFNYFRAHLMMVFKKLVEIETILSNPIKEIEKRKVAKKIRETLSEGERIRVSFHLKLKAPVFWNFMQIFFHSGARITELLRVKGRDVDLAKQRFKCLVKKRKQWTEVWRPIKDIAVVFWQQAMQNVHPDDYVFGSELQPGVKKGTRWYITRLWAKLVKAPVEQGGLGISADFYSIKHLNLDEIAASLSIEDAAKMAAHTSTEITKDYAIGEAERQNQRIKGVRNSFSNHTKKENNEWLRQVIIELNQAINQDREEDRKWLENVTEEISTYI